MANLQPLQALNLDSSQQLSFVRFFKTLPEKPKTTIRLFNRVDYYTVHGEDAAFAAREVFKSSAVIKFMGSQPNRLDYVVLSKGNMEMFIRDLLLVKLYRVEVFVNQGSIKSQEWVLEFKGSPGNLSQFEDILFSNADVVVNSTIMAVKYKGDDKNKIVGAVCVDCNERTFAVAEFTDSEHFTELEALVVQLGPKECLVYATDGPESKTICTILERSNVSVSKRKKSEFSTEGLFQDLNRLLLFEEDQIKDSKALQETNLQEACACLNAVIKYLELTSDQNNFEKFRFTRLDSNRFVHLDSAAMNALHVLPKKEGTMKNQSIFGLLDRCRTSHGKRLLAQWVRQPLRDLNQIEERLDVVDALLKDSEVRRQLHEEQLRRVPDLQLLANKLSRQKAGLQDCYKIFQGLERIPFLVDCLRNCNNKSINGAFVGPIADILQDTEKYQQMIDATMDMELVDKGEFLVKPSFDDQLKEMRDNMDSIEVDLKKQLNKAARDLNLDAGKTIKLDYNSIHGHHFRITLKEEPVLRKNKAYRVLDAIKGGVRFVSDKLESLNADYTQMKKSYEEHQKSIVTEVVRIASGYSAILWTLSEQLARLDVLVSFSVVASSAPKQYVRPRMVGGGEQLHLVGARHACLELQDGISYMPNDVHFDQAGHTFSIITGPNMGGKSTYIRSVGVCVLLAHLGCYVPCQEATVPLVDAILARVGAEDSQQRGLSTFMLEMIESAAILRTATKNSLVIIDELGRGTSTYEGCGIAWAIAEYLAQESKAFCLFATHFHEVTRLEQLLPQVTNQHVAAVTRDGQLVLLYQLRPGVCDRSFGIHVAKMADFPDRVVKFAEEKQIELESHRLDVDDEKISNNKEKKEEAEKLMREFIRSCQKLDLDNISQTELEKLRQSITSNENPYIKMLINSS